MKRPVIGDRFGVRGFKAEHPLLLICLSIALSVLVMRPCRAATSVLAGDLDGDGRVTASDVALVIRVATGNAKLTTARSIIAADLALPHGQIDFADARAVLARAVGLVQPEPLPLPGRLIDPTDGTEMTLVPAGPFPMGSHRALDQGPIHTVTLSAYYVDVTEATYAAYRRFVTATGYQPEGEWLLSYSGFEDDNHPVACVTWDDAVAYAQWVGKALPTEAQWEKAARGTDGRIYPWGNDFDPFRMNSYEDQLPGTTPVGSYPSGASPYGALDMAGNVWEWTADRYDPRYYAHSPSVDPPGPDHGDYRVMRGGAWNTGDLGSDTTSTNRVGCSPDSWGDVLGFRCVLPLDAPAASHSGPTLNERNPS